MHRPPRRVVTGAEFEVQLHMFVVHRGGKGPRLTLTDLTDDFYGKDYIVVQVEEEFTDGEKMSTRWVRRSAGE